jgi:choline dehydrogenase-like flavoprotein
VGYFHIIQENGERCNAARAYLSDAASEPNQHIFKDALVRRVIFAGTRATGVEQGDDHGRKRHWGQGYALHACGLRPKSRGTVALASANAEDAPLIDPRYLSAPEDLQVMIRAYRHDC